MKAIDSYLTQGYVKAIFDYKDGFLYWKVKKPGKCHIGGLGGNLCKSISRWVVCFDSKTHLSSRIIFLWHKGYLPEIVDHRDRNKQNDRIENLRAADFISNGKNRKSAKGASSGYLGVHLQKTSGRWISSIRVNGKLKHIGIFKNEEDAALSYNEKALLHHGEFANLNIIKAA